MIVGAIITNPKLQKKRQMTNFQSHIPPHLQSSMHGSPSFLQEQFPEHPLSALHAHLVSSLRASDTLCYVIQHDTKLLPCLFHPHSSGLGRFYIGINDWAQTTLLDTRL